VKNAKTGAGAPAGAPGVAAASSAEDGEDSALLSPPRTSTPERRPESCRTPRFNCSRSGLRRLGDNAFKDDLVTFAAPRRCSRVAFWRAIPRRLKLVPFVVGGSTNGNGIPCCVHREPLTATGAGDLPFRVIISGRVNRSRLVINADGTNANLTKMHEDSLRSRSIVPEVVDQIAS
jgi:hypothetical protein